MVFNAVAPASGLHAVGYSKLAWFFGACIWILWGVLTYSRLIVHPVGLVGFPVVVVLVVLIAAVVLWRNVHNRRRKRISCQAVSHVVLSMTAAMLISANFKQVHGIEFFYVPTDSMTPTIRVSEVLLTDTTVGAIKSVAPGDIAAFQYSKLSGDEIWIKRITDLTDNEMSVIGDNSNTSVSTRYLQDIPRARIQGVVKMVVGSYSSSHFSLGVRAVK